MNDWIASTHGRKDYRKWLQARHLLLVEDDFLLADCMKESLEAEGAVVVGPAASVERALNFLGSEIRVEAAILDVNVRGQGVFPVADLLMERDVPFIFVSGYDRELIPARFGRIRHCIKPVDIPSICRALAPG